MRKLRWRFLAAAVAVLAVGGWMPTVPAVAAPGLPMVCRPYVTQDSIYMDATLERYDNTAQLDGLALCYVGANLVGSAYYRGMQTLSAPTCPKSLHPTVSVELTRLDGTRQVLPDQQWAWEVPNSGPGLTSYSSAFTVKAKGQLIGTGVAIQTDVPLSHTGHYDGPCGGTNSVSMKISWTQNAPVDASPVPSTLPSVPVAAPLVCSIPATLEFQPNGYGPDTGKYWFHTEGLCGPAGGPPTHRVAFGSLSASGWYGEISGPAPCSPTSNRAGTSYGDENVSVTDLTSGVVNTYRMRADFGFGTYPAPMAFDGKTGYSLLPVDPHFGTAEGAMAGGIVLDDPTGACANPASQPATANFVFNWPYAFQPM